MRWKCSPHSDFGRTIFVLVDGRPCPSLLTLITPFDLILTGPPYLSSAVLSSECYSQPDNVFPDPLRDNVPLKGHRQ
jgi:hypothetical protein